MKPFYFPLSFYFPVFVGFCLTIQFPIPKLLYWTKLGVLWKFILSIHSQTLWSISPLNDYFSSSFSDILSKNLGVDDLVFNGKLAIHKWKMSEAKESERNKIKRGKCAFDE